ncbi:hypothetical protein ABVY18_003663 [Vibrio parahaemolyticus]|nr:hypothetical protein [Vibrio parahaemolyticus]EGR3062772.1 hypothetical protein [Vibrio parahaemolyticus]EGR3072554.1 hypothetical protein [Vibrio parahaemolyticus]EGR3174411.1 hypothetical protein [Vibrio parahaemolyticus]EJC6906636.1 hypothetical protein [Vibrio parahaemolyticus]
MSKIFKATCKSFKGQHPAGLVIHDVYVTDKFAKDAVEKAKEELKFWDPENFDKYQAPKVAVVKENAEQELEAYSLKKENHGQGELKEEEDKQLPDASTTTNLFDEQSATVAQFPIVDPYAVCVAVAISKGKFLSSYSVINAEKKSVAIGFINTFHPKQFDEIDNAVSFAIGNAIDAISSNMADIFGHRLPAAIKSLSNYASDAESEFIDHYTDDLNLFDAKISEKQKLTTSNKNDDISIIADAVICHPDYKNCADPHEPEEFIGQVKANLKEILDEYGKLPGAQMAEHIQSLASIRDLYNLGPCEEIAGLYLTDKGSEMSAEAGKALAESAKESQLKADNEWPKDEPLNYDSSNEWQRLAFTILSKTNEAADPMPQQYKEIAAKLCGVFAERGLELMAGDCYSTAASELITHAIKADSVIATLFNLRELRGLISDIAENSTKEKSGIKPNHNTENEHECFIAEILSRLQTDGANFLTSEQFEEAGEKFNIILDEANKTYGNEFDRVSTLENIRNIDWDNISEATKVFLNIRSLRACFRENVEVIKTTETASNEVEKPEVATNEASSGNNEQINGNSEQINGNSEQINGNSEQINGNSEPKQQESLPEEAKQVVEPGNAVPASNDDTVSDNGDGNGEAVKQIDVDALESKWSNNANMRIWSQVHKTDSEYTKRDHNGRNSISTQYRIMKMTEAFGPVGLGWGYKVLREWTTQGAPIVVNNELTGMHEIIHHCEVEIWYKHQGQKSEPITHYGDTRQFYYSRGWQDKPGHFVNDDEVHKKSLSDALGKAMSMLGVCADVYLGEHDDAHIETLNHNVVEAAKKVRHLEEEEKIRKEVNEKAAAIVEEMQGEKTKIGVNTLRAKALHVISGLPDISDEQKRRKSSVIQQLEVRYNQRLKEVAEEQERKKQEKAAKAAADKAAEKQEA